MKSKGDIAIKFIHVSKKYTINHEKPTLIEKLLNGKNEEFWALKNINFEIKKGESVGIIGPNGCGKTTLLKLIAGINTPTSGSIETQGKVVSLIDIEAGFNPEITGAQNIYLNGMLLGMKKCEIDSRIDDIIKFADIGNYIDVPLFTYSEGMKLRLGYSVLINTGFDTILLDENLAVGDKEFQKKSFNKIRECFSLGKTVVSVTHLLAFFKYWCKRVIWIEGGKIIQDGPAREVISEYINHK